MKKSLIKKFAKFILLLSIIVLLIIRIFMVPFLGNPFKKFHFAVNTHLYLENKYENDTFDIKSLNYDYKTGVYYALVESKEYSHIGTFRVEFLERDECTVLKDNLQEQIICTNVEGLYLQLGYEFGYDDMYANYSPMGNQLTISVSKVYSEKDLPVIYSFIEQARKDSIVYLNFYFKGSNETTHFIFTPEHFESINSCSDIIRVCSPVIF